MKTKSIRANLALLVSLGMIGCGGGDVGAPGSEQSGDAELDLAAQGAELAAPAAVDPSLRALPVYRVVRSGLDAAQAEALAGALGVGRDAQLLGEDGAIRYLDKERFQKLPMKKIEAIAPLAADENGMETAAAEQAVDFEALKALRVLDEDKALGRVEAALAAAGVELAGVAKASHAVFEGFDAAGNEIARVNLDTQVSYEQRLEGLRLIGPGAKVKVALDAEGRATQVVMAVQELERGEEVAILPPSEAQAMCAEVLGGGEGLRATAELVYHAPELAKGAQVIFPHYACGGQKVVKGNLVDIRKVMVPAVLDVPRAELTMRTKGGSVQALAEVSGGTAPYTFQWASSSGSIDQSAVDPSKVEYTVHGRAGQGAVETLTLYVTDANGLTAKVAETALVAPEFTKLAAGAGAPSLIGGSPYGSIGTEWIGSCGGLGGSAGNAGGFVSRFASSGINATFNWGDFGAWEEDFKDPAFATGNDTNFADAVDLVFYTGHANGEGFSFCSNVDDTWLGWQDAKWGNSNLEWLVIAACGPLQDDGGQWQARWDDAFDGLHLLMGYATISWDNTTEGSTFADGILRYDHLNVRESWAMTAVAVQPSDVIYATMGVWGPSWTLPNWDDYFWGMGATGPDTWGASKWGYWRISAYC